MATKKRSRPSSSPDSPTDAGPPNKKVEQRQGAEQQTSLEGFLLLPQELKTSVLELALFSHDIASPSWPILDVPLALNLMTASRDFYEQTARIVYARVKLSRPSSLASFHQALATRPLLRSHVSKVEIGPTDELPPWWWHLSVVDDPDDDGPGFWVANGWQSHEEEHLPKWCSSGRRWWPRNRNVNCTDLFIYDTIRVAQLGVGVDCEHPRYGLSSNHEIGSDEWLVRSFEVQAVLDLYLAQMRRVEDEKGYPVRHWNARPWVPSPKIEKKCEAGICEHYPHIGVTADGSLPQQPSDSLPGQASFFVSLTEARSHLARRRALIDRFDHPLLFARSRLGRYHVNDQSKPELANPGPYLIAEDDLQAQGLDPTRFKGVVGLIRSISTMVSRTCRLELHPLLGESVGLGWKREAEADEE